MKNSDESVNATVILNKNDLDGFLDLNSSYELKEVINVLNKINDKEKNSLK